VTEYVLAVEGQTTEDKRLIRPGALTWETPMPVYGPRTEGEWGTPVIGTIESIRRVEFGRRAELLATITWFGEEPTDTGLCAQVDSMEADHDVTDEHTLILKGGRIRAAFMGAPAWPETRINTGGIVPPFITDRIPGHEGDQP